VTRLFADAACAAFCAVMLDGRFWTAGELARSSGVAAATASEYLAQLTAGGVVEVASQSGHRYFRLASPEVAAALAASAAVTPAAPVRTLREDVAGPALREDVAGLALREGRTCYDHLAGRLGVALTQALIGRGVITADFGQGDFAALEPLGIAVPPVASRTISRTIVRPCVDWTERRYHAAGALPAAFLRRLLELGWLRQLPQHRAVCLTDPGRDGLGGLLSWHAESRG
jgi:hypothetical protein